MAVLNLRKLTEFPRTVEVEFPHPTKPGKPFFANLRAGFNHIEAEEYAELMGINEKTFKPNHTQEYIFNKIVAWVNPEDIEGVDTKDEAKAACSVVIAVQNAFITDYAECISGFARKNSKK